MNTQDVIFYDLLSRARKSGKGQLQGFITDQVMQKYNELDIPGFKFAEDMQLDFTYEQVQGEFLETAVLGDADGGERGFATPDDGKKQDADDEEKIRRALKETFRVKCSGTEFSLSGVQNKVQQFHEKHGIPAETAAYQQWETPGACAVCSRWRYCVRWYRARF